MFSGLAVKTLAYAAVCFVVFGFLGGQTASALSGSQFKAGNIIDDSVFYSGDTMSSVQIQEFLNAKVPVCDTNGTQMHSSGVTRAQRGASTGNPAPYTCLKDFRQNTAEKAAEANLCSALSAKNNQSAAQIIYDVGRACGISQKSIIVMLQKEQGIITDDWPWQDQYTKAMGYYCPDDPSRPGWCHPDYAGFFNQVYNAARQFKRYKLSPSSWNFMPHANNMISYQANAPQCGRRAVYVENYATAGLYNYTPYTPNQAALDNLYGTGDGCSAYGNRNFWRMHNDWFGSTNSADELLSDGRTGIYYVSNGRKYHVPTMADYYNYGFKDEDIGKIRSISTTDLNTIPYAENRRAVSVVVASQEQGIFLVSNGYKYYIPSMQLFSDFGFVEADIIQLSEQSIGRFVTGANHLNTIISDPRGFTFKVESGERRAIYQPGLLSQFADAPRGSKLSDTTIGYVRVGVPILSGRITVITATSRYMVLDNQWYSVPSTGVSNCIGSTDTVTMNLSQGRPGPLHANVQNCFVRVAGQGYILDGSTKYPVSGNAEISYHNASGPLASRVGVMTTRNTNNIFGTNTGIYELQAGKKRYINSMNYVYRMTGGAVPPELKTDSVAALPSGGDIYDDNTVLASPNTGIHVQIEGKLYYIGSMDQFRAYGFSERSIVNTSNWNIDQQDKGGNLPGARVSEGGLLFVINKGKKQRVVGASDIAAFGSASSFTPVTAGFVGRLSNGANMTRFIASGNSGIFHIENGTRKYITSWERFLQMGGTLQSVTELDNYVLQSFPRGANI